MEIFISIGVDSALTCLLQDLMTRKLYQNGRFLREFVDRVETGAIAFLICVFIMITIGSQLEPWKQMAIPLGLAIVIVNLGRYGLAQMYLRQKVTAHYFFETSQALIVINALMWNIFFLTAYFSERLMGMASFTSLFLTAGFSAGAAVNLAASLRASIPFQILMILPAAATAFYFFMATQAVGLLMIAGVCMAFVYFNIRATRGIRRDMLDLFNQEYELIETRKRLAEEQEKLIHSSRLASLGEMAGGMAHEINNPLAILLLGLDTIQDPPPGQDPVTFRAAKLATMKRAVQRITKIVKGLKNFAQQGEALPFEPISVKTIIDETLEFFLGRMQKMQVSYRIEGAIESKVTVRSLQISQVLLNLMSNAMDAMSEQAEDKWILIQVSAQPNEVWIDVSDSGPGLHPKVRDRLFQPFVTSKDPGQGMGLGLSISKGIMKEHKGDLVFLTGQPHTTFRIIVPQNRDASLTSARDISPAQAEKSTSLQARKSTQPLGQDFAEPWV